MPWVLPSYRRRAIPAAAPARPVIRPINQPGHYRTASLCGLTVRDVAVAIGFAPNVHDDPGKVQHSWGFTVDGVFCAVWSWKDTERTGLFSAYGPAESLRAVFGAAHVAKGGF